MNDWLRRFKGVNSAALGLLDEVAEPEVGQMGEQLGALFYSVNE